jgi:NAD(P)-dependent dehydrogenase (short-subunit alcohol dehydrogenase family)
MEIRDKVALVTGGASGIGRATAERLSAEGARVVVADVDIERGPEVAAAVGGSFAELDVSDPDAWQQTMDNVIGEHGALHIVHLNAGIVTPKSGARGGLVDAFDVTRMEDADYRKLCAVNVDGVIFGCRAAVQAMAGHPGALVATASVAGLIAYAGDPLYCMTKHAVVGFVRAMAPLLQQQQISFDAVCPGVVETDIVERSVFELVRGAGVSVMQPSAIADAVVQAITSEDTGRCYVCLPDAPPQKHEFPKIDVLSRSQG